MATITRGNCKNNNIFGDTSTAQLQQTKLAPGRKSSTNTVKFINYEKVNAKKNTKQLSPTVNNFNVTLKGSKQLNKVNLKRSWQETTVTEIKRPSPRKKIKQGIEDANCVEHKEADTLSLYASSIALSEEPVIRKDLYTLQWVQSQQLKTTIENNTQLETTIDNNTQLENFSNSSMSRPHKNSINNRNNRMNLFSVLKTKLCRYHFLKDCYKKACRFPHYITEDVKNIIINSRYEDLHNLYNNSKQFKNLYPHVLELYIEVLGNMKKPTKILNLIEDILNYECNDHTSYFETIIVTFKKMGFSYIHIVNEILSINASNTMFDRILEILLTIIVKDSNNLEENWNLIQTITKRFNKKELHFGIVSDMMLSCINKLPLSYNLCRYICADIIEKYDINLLNISEFILNNFINILNTMNLDKHADYLKAQIDKMKPKEYHCDSTNTNDTVKIISDSSNSSCITSSTEPRLFCHEEMLDCDIIKLNRIIRKNSVKKFIKMLDKYKRPETRQSFVLNALVLLKKGSKLTKNFLPEMFNLLEEEMVSDMNLKHILEMLGINIILQLRLKCSWIKACNILKVFNNIDSLVNFKCFSCQLSVVGKYFFICKILIRGNQLAKSLRVLKRSSINILDSDNWPTESSATDKKTQANVIKEFIYTAIKKDVPLLAYDLLDCIIKNNYILEIDIWKYVNQVLKKMLSKPDKYILQLANAANNLLCIWNLQKISVFFLRNLIILLCRHGFKNFGVKLYQKCCEDGIYYIKYHGSETKIFITTDMALEELFLTFSEFFRKLVNNNCQVSDIIVYINLTNQCDLNKINNVSVPAMKNMIRKILRCLIEPIFVNINDNPYITIKTASIVKFINVIKNRQINEQLVF